MDQYRIESPNATLNFKCTRLETIQRYCIVNVHRVSEKSSTSYFAEYFRAGLTDCKNFNGYRVRDNQ